MVLSWQIASTHACSSPKAHLSIDRSKESRSSRVESAEVQLGGPISALATADLPAMIVETMLLLT